MIFLQLIGGIIGLLADIPLLISISKNKATQNFTTWMLWALLDVIAAISAILQHGNYWLQLGYALGATSVSILLAYKKQIRWTSFDTFVAILVLGCMIVWWKMGNEYAIIATSIALCIASIPQILATFKDPETTPTWLYLIFCSANFLSLLGGTNWTVEQILYPASALTFCFIIAILSMRKPKKISLRTSVH